MEPMSPSIFCKGLKNILVLKGEIFNNKIRLRETEREQCKIGNFLMEYTLLT